MKKLLCMILATVLLTSCGTVFTNDSATASGSETYEAYLRENLAAMPKSLIIGDESAAKSVGISLDSLSDDGFITRAAGGGVMILGKTDEGLDRGVRDFVKYGNNDSYSKTYGEGYRVKRLTIAGNDISEYVIVYDSDDYNGNIKLAADELVSYIEKTCGAVIAAYTDVEFDALETKPERTITLTVDYPTHTNEDFTIEVGADGNMTIFGGRVRGCLYGVYDLLEENVGWRFYDDIFSGITYGYNNPEHKGFMEYLYEADHVDLTAEINRTEEPLFLSRRMDDLETQFNADSKNKEKIGENWYSGHGLYHINWGDAANEENMGNQPCLTDEDILERIDWHVLNEVKLSLEAGQEIGRDFFGLSLGQSDGGDGYCKCEDCMAVIAEEKAASGLYVRTANRAAQLLKDNGYGDVHVNILAYVETNVPPAKTKPLDNVRVAFCFYLNDKNTYHCNVHPLGSRECGNGNSSNNRQADRFEKWVEICAPGSLDVWYYPFHAGVAITGAPMVLNLYEDIKYLSEHGVTGIINTVCSNAGESQLQTLVAYMLNEICWNFPESYDEYLGMIEEWFFLQYGDGGAALYEYFLEYERLGKKVDCYAVCWDSVIPTRYIGKDDMLANFDYFCGLFEKARRLADTRDQEIRVEVLEAGMLYLGICHLYDDWYVNGTDAEKAKLTERYKRVHELATKYHLAVYCYISPDSAEFAPEVLDLEQHPLEWYTDHMTQGLQP